MAGIRVKDISKSAERFAQRGAAAQKEYLEGLAGTGAAWQEETANSEQNYEAGVQAAMGRKAFGRGVRKSGGQYFEQRAIQVGGQRFAPGIIAGKDNWAEGSKPYLEAAKGIQLPAAGPKGAAQNAERSRTVQLEFRRLKESLA